MLSLPSSLLRPDPPVSPAPRTSRFPRLYRGPSLGGSARGDPRDLPCFGCQSLFDCRPASTPGDRSPASAQLLRRARRPSHNPECLASPFPTVSLEHPYGLLVGRCHDAIGSRSATALEVARPPGLTDLDAHRHRAAGTCTPELALEEVTFPKSRVSLRRRTGQLRRRVLPPQHWQRYRLHPDFHRLEHCRYRLHVLAKDRLRPRDHAVTSAGSPVPSASRRARPGSPGRRSSPASST
jgi:hypothetical protein